MTDRLAGIRYTEDNFESGKDLDEQRPDADPVDAADAINAAVDYFVRMRMSRGGLGTAFAWSDKLRGGQPGDVNAWETIRTGKDGLLAINRQLQGVEVLHRDALSLVADFGRDPDWLFYLDPPYLQSTRTAEDAYGNFEIGEAAHRDLAGLANTSRAAIALSGYDSIQYQQWYAQWHRTAWDMANHSGQSSKKQRRHEVLWMNYQLA